MYRLRDSRGIALVVAMYALVILGALVSAMFFLSVLEERLGLATLKLGSALNAADAGAAEVLVRWDRDAYNQLPQGGTVTIAPRPLSSSAWYQGSVKRLNRRLFYVAVDGYSRDSTSRQQVGLIARLAPLAVSVGAALTSHGPVTLGASSSVDGNDAPPAGWTDCPASAPPGPALRLSPPDSGAITLNDCSGYSCLSGNPMIQADSTIGAGPLTGLAGLQFSNLATLATKRLSGGSYVAIGPSTDFKGACDFSDPLNWGDPLSPLGPCGPYMPLIFIAGDASISGTEGQGVLIVDGDLTIAGGLRFDGLVIVRGTLSLSGTGGRLVGAVEAGSATLDAGALASEATVRYSSCALSKALDATARPLPLGERRWVNRW